MVAKPTQSREGVKGGFPLAGSRGGAPLWGLGQRPNCSVDDQLQGSRQQRRRQRSIPAPNFALPQERLQAALSITCILSRQMGATDQHGKYSAFHAGLLYCRANRICGSYHPLFLVTTSTTASPANTISRFTCAICLRLFPSGVRSFHLA